MAKFTTSIKDKMLYFIGNESINQFTYNALLVGGAIICLISMVESVIVGAAGLHLFLLFLMLLDIGFASILVNVMHKNSLATSVLLLTSQFILFPAMFMTCGGIRGGMLFWMMVGIICSFLRFRGKLCVIFVVAEVILDYCVILYSVRKPEHVVQLPSNFDMILDVAISMFTTAIAMGIVVKYQCWLYDREMARQEDQRIHMELLKREAEQANIAKSEFLANMSHEIRTPMNAIIGISRITLQEEMSNEVRNNVTDILHSSESLLSIINDILDFSKIESGDMEILEEPYHFSSMLHDTLTIIENRLEEGKVAFKKEIEPTIPNQLCGDQGRVRQVLINILNNAVKFTKEGTVTLKVDWEKYGNKAVLIFTVIDTGQGIKKENLDTIFKRFSRVEMRENRAIEGTGLGLSITKHLVQLMHGDITVSSEYGKGSTFCIRIPQVIVDEAASYGQRMDLKKRTIKKDEHPVRSRFHNASVLVVDDNRMNLKVARGLLKPYGMDLDVAESGQECIDKVEDRIFDLILLDHMMPQMDGAETLLRLKECKDFHTPVVALTANAMVGARQMYEEMGFSDYLSKPMKVAELEGILKKYLSEFETEEVDEQDNKEIENMTYGEELNIEHGMEYAAMGDEEFYIETLQIFLDETTQNELQMGVYLSQGDLKTYTVLVHGLKSNARIIGAMKLGDFAEDMEMKGKAQEKEYILEHHDALMAHLEKVRVEIRAFLKERENG